MHRLPRPSPALLVSLVALFFALGGTAFAVGSKEFAAQPRCSVGAIRGIAVLIAGPTGLDSLTSTYSSAPNLFGYHWNCGGGKIMVRKPSDFPGVEIRFAGNPSSIAVVSSVALGVPYAGSVSRMPDGSFRVTMGGSNSGAPGPWQSQVNVPFAIFLL